MKKKTVKPDRICFECLHYEACQSWNIGSLVKTAADNCVNYRASVDVRPVVMCLHCKNWDTGWAPNCGKEYGHFCPMVGTVTRADWFCADGEKREETTNGN